MKGTRKPELPILSPNLRCHRIFRIALRVLPDFQPALPLDAASLIWAGAGLVLGLAVCELVKLPLALWAGAARG